MVDKVNQPGAYLVADIEKSEKELTFARKKIKKLDEEVKNLRAEKDLLRTVIEYLTNHLGKGWPLD